MGGVPPVTVARTAHRSSAFFLRTGPPRRTLAAGTPWPQTRRRPMPLPRPDGSLLLLPLLVVGCGGQPPQADDSQPEHGVSGTFSIVAADPEAGVCGAA